MIIYYVSEIVEFFFLYLVRIFLQKLFLLKSNWIKKPCVIRMQINGTGNLELYACQLFDFKRVWISCYLQLLSLPER